MHSNSSLFSFLIIQKFNQMAFQVWERFLKRNIDQESLWNAFTLRGDRILYD